MDKIEWLIPLKKEMKTKTKTAREATKQHSNDVTTGTAGLSLYPTPPPRTLRVFTKYPAFETVFDRCNNSLLSLQEFSLRPFLFSCEERKRTTLRCTAQGASREAACNRWGATKFQLSCLTLFTAGQQIWVRTVMHAVLPLGFHFQRGKRKSCLIDQMSTI